MQETVRIGWLGSWMGLRAVTAILLYFGLLLLSSIIRSQHLEPNKICMLAVLASILIFLHPLASGYADRAGIHFRRYLFPRFVPWEEVETVLWSTRQIMVFLKGKRGLQRRIDFLSQSTLMNSLSEAFGERVREADFIRWLASTPLEQTNRVEVRHMDSRQFAFWNPAYPYKGEFAAVAWVWGIALMVFLLVRWG